MILPTTWPFPSQDKQDAATDQRAALVSREAQHLESIAKRGCRRPPNLDDVQDAPY